jgi:hypothetical protein
MRTHRVANLPGPTEVIYGLTNAIDAVKDRQHTLAIQETGHAPALKNDIEFRVETCSAKPSYVAKTFLGVDNSEDEYVEEFKILIQDLFTKFKRFPRYMIHIVSTEYHIPDSEIPLLLSRFTHNGTLIALPNDYFTLSLEK